MKSLPIGVRLTAWYFVMLALILALFGSGAYIAMRDSIHRTLDEELQDRLESARRLIERSSGFGTDGLKRELREHSELAADALLQVSDPQGNWLYRSAAIGDYEIPKSGKDLGGPFTYTSKGLPLRVLGAEVRVADQMYLVQVAAPLDDFYDALRRFGSLLVVSIPILLLCAAAGGYWMSRRALAPVDQITETAKNISVQNLSRRLIVPQTSDELQRLSETLNKMLERLQDAFDKITQFTADASHELRTPVAVMRTRAELTLRRPRSAEEYRAALVLLHGELEKTSDLVEKLMLLARADHGAESLNLSIADLADIIRDACSQGRTLSEAKQISFSEQASGQPVWIRGDEHALRRLFLILLDNAVKYTPVGGSIQVSLNQENGCAVAEVRDTGIGIAADDLPNIFQRFYRADKARSRESGGVGLGLSIGRWIAEMHTGTIEVQSSLGHGSTFQVRLPLSNGQQVG